MKTPEFDLTVEQERLLDCARIVRETPVPIVGQFDNSHDCKVAVGYARMNGYRVTVFRRKDLNDKYIERGMLYFPYPKVPG